MTRNRWRGVLALVLSLGLLTALAACGDDDDADEGTGDEPTAVEGPTIRIASQSFPEAQTLAQLYGQYLEAQGFDVDLQPPGGDREALYGALADDRTDLILEFTGSGARFLTPDIANTADTDETYQNLVSGLTPLGLVATDYAQAEDRNALVVLKSFADEHSLTKISDLANVEGGVVLGALEDCRNRPDCKAGYEDPEGYGLTFKDFVPLEYGPPLAEALRAGTIQAAQYSSAAPEIASGDFVVLDDDKALLSRDNVVPVLTQAIVDEYGTALTDALNDLSTLLKTEDLVELNVSTDVDKEEPADVATAWLREHDLL
jgi:osmoprotectant transport system substrate-binding protein